MHRFCKYLALGLIFILMGFGGTLGLAYAQCALVVLPDESLQEAIDKASLGATLCLESGVWREKLEIKAKTLLLKGVGKEETILDGLRFENVPCCVNGITVKENSQLSLENLSIRNFTANGISVSDTSRLQLLNVYIFRNENGIRTQGSAHLEVDSSQIVGNRGVGILAAGSTQTTLQNALVAENGIGGLLAIDKADVFIQDSEITENRGTGVATSSLFNNLINFEGGARVLVENSRIFKNKQGLYVEYYAELEVKNSEIFENTLNGVTVERLGLLSLVNNKIYANGAYGLSVYSIDSLAKCQGNKIEDNGNGSAGGNFSSNEAQQKCA